MLVYVVAYLATLVVFIGIDSIWLTIAANRLYKPLLGDILLPMFLPGPAIAFYALYIVGVVIFVTNTAMRTGHWTTALIYGALFGFFSYSVYDLTNWATLRNWVWQIAVADIIWGTVLTGTAATLGFLATRAISRSFHLGV